MTPANAITALLRGDYPLARDKADTLMLLFACLLVLAPQALQMPFWVSSICSVTLLWRGWITFSGKRMPSLWLLVPLSLLAVAAVYWHYRSLFGRQVGVTMLVLLFTFKLMEMHAKRDFFVVMFLSFFLILTNFFYSQSIGMALLTIISMIVILSAQVSFQYTGKIPPLRQRLRLGAMIFAMASPLALVLFVLFPRIQGPLWGLPGDANGARTGLSDSMTPGNIAHLANSEEVAFRVKFLDPAPPSAKLYWRGPVLGNYDGHTWLQISPNQRAIGENRRTRRPVEMQAHGDLIRHQVTLEPHGRNWLFALELPQSPPVLEGNYSRITQDFQLVTTHAITQRLRYDAASFADFSFQANDSITNMLDWLSLPPGLNPRSRQFAQSLKQSADKRENVNAVLKFFHNNNFSYTLDPPLLGLHEIDDFLFSTRTGFCEHYASTFVVLMRMMDIPARVVTGYQGGENNPVDGFVTIRQSDAHAWAEVWIEKRGWLRVDPTAAVAPSRVEKNLASAITRRGLNGLIDMDISKNPWLAAVRFNLSAVGNAWSQWVLDYTPKRQLELIGALGFANANWRTLAALMFAFGSIALAIVMLPLLLKQRKKIAPLDAVYFALCQQMAKRGYPKALYEGPRAYGERLELALASEPAEKLIALRRFLQLYTLYKYGNLQQGEEPGGPGKQPQSRPNAVIPILKSLLTQIR